MDREKVIKGLEYCIKSEDCRGCIYWEGIRLHEGCPLHSDALAMLKEQEAEIEQLNRFVNGFSRDAIPVIRCKDCKQSGIDSTSYPQYWCSAHDEYHDGDWFCADGERKESW